MAGTPPLAAWVALAARRLRPGGTVSVIQRAARLPDLLAGLPPTLGSLELLPARRAMGDEPRTLLLRAARGRARSAFSPRAPSRPGDAGDGEDFAPGPRVLRDGAPVPWR
jgi:tRNA1(Val) A37 N6-methylase TrmN6